jgi:5-methylcytosine-specific restriction endonuclease McrA
MGRKIHTTLMDEHQEIKKIRASKEYTMWRIAVFERDNYTCQHCGQVGGDLNADHIKPFSTHPKLRLDINNGRTLCVPCHKKTPTFLSGAKKKSTPIQKARQEELKALGCKVYEIHSLEEMQQVS